MSVIQLPFTPAMRRLTLAGRKTCTSRYKQYGVVGDTFYVEDYLFQITQVQKAILHYVASAYYQQEGFNDRLSFLQYWKQLHPRRIILLTSYVFTHFYKLVDPVRQSAASQTKHYNAPQTRSFHPA